MRARRGAPLALLVALVSLLLSFVVLGHGPAELRGALPLGQAPSATVPVFNLWTIGWNVDRAAHGFHDYWDAPIFHPERRAFVYSEAQPLTALLAPVWWWGSPAAAYDAFLVVSLALNAFFAWRLARRLGLAHPGAASAGALVLALPFVHGQLEVLQLVPLWGILGALGAILDHAAAPSLLRGVRAGVWLAVSYLLCNYYGLFLVVLLVPGGAVLLGRRLAAGSTWRRSVLGATAAFSLVAPVALEQLAASREQRLDRSREEIVSLSADLRDYAAPAATRLPSLSPSRWLDLDGDELRGLGWGA